MNYLSILYLIIIMNYLCILNISHYYNELFKYLVYTVSHYYNELCEYLVYTVSHYYNELFKYISCISLLYLTI